MHELLLQAPAPLRRHDPILNIPAGLAAMQPVPVREEHHIFRPNRQPNSLAALRAGQVGAPQDVDVPKNQAQMQVAMAMGDLYYLQVVRTLEEGDETGRSEGDGRGDEQVKGEEEMEIDGEKVRIV